MKYIDAERLKEAIDKLYETEIRPWLSGVSAKSAIYQYVFPAIEELQKEQSDVNLEKEIERWWGEKYMKNAEGLPILPVVQGIARHFAEWQSKQDKETIELAEDHAYLAGSVNEREKMMKEAVPFYEILKVVPPGPERDKVRIIIVKED